MASSKARGGLPHGVPWHPCDSHMTSRPLKDRVPGVWPASWSVAHLQEAVLRVPDYDPVVESGLYGLIIGDQHFAPIVGRDMRVRFIAEPDRHPLGPDQLRDHLSRIVLSERLSRHDTPHLEMANWSCAPHLHD